MTSSPERQQPDAERLVLVSGIAGRLMLLSTDAVHGFAAIVERFELGQQRHGDLDLSRDRRDWHVEAIEELLDMAVYRGISIVGARRQSPPAPSVAITFDVSDVEEPNAGPRARSVTIPPLGEVTP